MAVRAQGHVPVSGRHADEALVLFIDGVVQADAPPLGGPVDRDGPRPARGGAPLLQAVCFGVPGVISRGRGLATGEGGRGFLGTGPGV